MADERSDGQPYRWDPESAKAASDKAAEVRATNAALRKSDPLHQVRESAGDLLADLLKAARGQPPFEDLPPDKRFAALLRALEYGIGRPAPLRTRSEVSENADEAPKAEEGLSIQ